ncbi:hypothetical protein BH11PSE3_BH11PSE3_33330 [soil metagenome]
MRNVLLLLTLLTAAACDQSSQWLKAGVDSLAADSDLRQCRHAAMQEMVRLQATQLSFAVDAPPLWNYRWEPTRLLLRRAAERNQMQGEQMLAVVCMRDRGYVIATTW